MYSGWKDVQSSRDHSMLTGSLQTFTSVPIVPPAETTHAWLTG